MSDSHDSGISGGKIAGLGVGVGVAAAAAFIGIGVGIAFFGPVAAQWPQVITGTIALIAIGGMVGMSLQKKKEAHPPAKKEKKKEEKEESH